MTDQVADPVRIRRRSVAPSADASTERRAAVAAAEPTPRRPIGRRPRRSRGRAGPRRRRMAAPRPSSSMPQLPTATRAPAQRPEAAADGAEAAAEGPSRSRGQIRARRGARGHVGRADVRRRHPPRGRALGVHGARGELPGPARGPRGRRHQRRRDAPRGRGGVHGRGARPADGPPGRLHRHARRRRLQPRDRHPHRRSPTPARCSRSSARSSARARGREGFQEIDVTETIGRLAKWSAEPTDVASAVEAAGRGGRPGAQRAAGSGRAVRRRGPARRGGPRRHRCRTLARVPPPRPTDDEVRDVLQLLAGAERPVILAGAGVLRARTSNDLVRLAELLRVPVVASWRRGDVISERPPAVSRDDRLRRAADRARAPRRRRRDPGHRLPARRDHHATAGPSRRPGPAGRTSTSHPGSVAPDLPPAEITVTADARLFLRAAVARLESRGVLDAASTDARSARNAEDRAAFEAATVIDGHDVGRPRRASRARS